MKEPKRTINLTTHWMRPALMAGALAGLMALSASAADVANPAVAKPAIDPQADELLRRMGDYLAQAPFFSVSAEIWQDVQLSSGQQVQAGRTIELQVRRPNRFHAEVRSTRRNRALYYDGKSITLVNRVQNFYGSIPAPATLDEALDVASERFGITLPLEDLIVSDPYQNAMRKIVSGIRLGPATVLGVPCEHLAFSLGTVDWQVWIEDGAQPVPRKIVITYKDEEGTPEYTAILSHWDFQTKLADFVFNFEPPAGASKIDVAEIKSRIQAHKHGGK
ncbi:MAG TPA: DUF2092 domain-containing protein [Verrucomicrobiae bacterium]|nr:DUF2092 domain-containing protein [Verrucomicrobiae bacterium]